MNFPSIPQGFNQLIVAILLFLLFYNLTKTESQVNETLKKENQLINSPDWLNLFEDSISISDNLAQLKNQRLEIDSILNNKRNKRMNYNSLKKVSDSINHEIYSQSRQYGITKYKLDMQEFYTNSIKNEFQDDRRITVINAIFSIFLSILLIYFLFNMYKENKLISEKFKRELYENRIYLYCQSCGKVFSPMLLHGKNKDGAGNEGFCIECYDDGKFLNKQLSKQEVVNQIKKLNPTMKDVEEKVSRLVRWNQNPYNDIYNL